MRLDESGVVSPAGSELTGTPKRMHSDHASSDTANPQSSNTNCRGVLGFENVKKCRKTEHAEFDYSPPFVPGMDLQHSKSACGVDTHAATRQSHPCISEFVSHLPPAPLVVPGTAHDESQSKVPASVDVPPVPATLLGTRHSLRASQLRLHPSCLRIVPRSSQVRYPPCTPCHASSTFRAWRPSMELAVRFATTSVA